MASDVTTQVKLRQRTSLEVHHSTEMHTLEETSMDGAIKKRPRSASYAALRSAVFQLSCLSDFTKEKIGSGFFAEVFKVKHKVTGEVMVLKMNKSRKTSKQMLSEIQLMNRLSHPNILRFKGSCVHEGQLHALTEFINGGSLEELLHDRSVELSWSVRVKIARDIAKGMAYLHSRGVSHRDLNSRNCLIQKHPNGNLTTVVADFGLAAKIKQRKRRSYTETVGSPYWMAPECLNGKQYCELADVFSYGITLAEIMTRMPADPDFIPRTMHYGVNCEAMRQLCVGCPEELFQLMCNCCQLDPDDRPSFEEVVQAIEAIPTDTEDTYPQPPSDSQLSETASTASDIDNQDYLRSCFSEPTLRLTDIDSGGIGGHLGKYRLDSIGSSMASTGSSCDSFSEEPARTLSTADASLPNSVQNASTPLSEPVVTSTLEVKLEENNDTIVTMVALSLEKNTHRELKKTNSLTLPGSDSSSPNLNSSMQTLIAEVNTDCNELTNGGGDSGIDPGEMEVFKFPPSDSRSKQLKGSEGDQTPVDTSPLHKLIPETSRKLSPEAGSPHQLSPVRTPSDCSVSCVHTTPLSPLARSWASSELSFHLPKPSTPYAPPCTPIVTKRRSNSCPSSPTLHTKPFRLSLDASLFHFTSVDRESPSSHRQPHWENFQNSSLYCDNSLDKDFDFEVRQRKHSYNLKHRSVHFEDEVCTNLHLEHFSRMPSSRTRSHSSPAQPSIKKSQANYKENTVYSLTLANCKNTYLSHKSPNIMLCKGYHITMSSARLSSSLPNLFI